VDVKINQTVAEALKELNDLVETKYREEHERAHAQHWNVIFPEHVDHQFNAWKQCYERLLAVMYAEDERQLNEIARLGT
jgi:hypothetical protein